MKKLYALAFESQSECLAWATQLTQFVVPIFFNCVCRYCCWLCCFSFFTHSFFSCVQSNALVCFGMLFVCYVYVFFLWIYFDGFCFHVFFSWLAKSTCLTYRYRSLQFCVFAVFVDHRRRNEKTTKQQAQQQSSICCGTIEIPCSHSTYMWMMLMMMFIPFSNNSSNPLKLLSN